LSSRKVVLDTNLYIDWMKRGLRDAFMIGPGFVRYLSAVVQMELRVGARTLPARRAVDQLLRAYRSGGRVVAPDAQLFDTAGRTLRALHETGREVRRSSVTSSSLTLHARSERPWSRPTQTTRRSDRSRDFDLEVVST
jgi:predicted nucleic acid-binding protein